MYLNAASITNIQNMIKVLFRFCSFLLLVTIIICIREPFPSPNIEEIRYFARAINITILGPLNETVVSESKLTTQEFTQYYSATFKVVKTYILGRIALQLEKCHNRQDDCEHFQAWNFTRFCRAMQMKNQMWSSIAHSITPKTFFRTCPRFDQGIYKVENVSLDFDRIVKFYNEAAKYYWKVRSRFYNRKGGLESTTFMHLHFIKSIKRNRINNE